MSKSPCRCSATRTNVRIDCEHGFARRTAVAHDGGQLRAALDCDNTASGIWDDTAYRSALDLALLERRGLRPHSSAKSQEARRCRFISPAAMPAARAACGPGLSTSLAVQKCRLVLLIRAVGVMRAPRSKSAWPTSPGWPGSMPEPRPPDDTVHHHLQDA
jgi:IS5 family transposase